MGYDGWQKTVRAEAIDVIKEIDVAHSGLYEYEAIMRNGKRETFQSKKDILNLACYCEKADKTNSIIDLYDGITVRKLDTQA